MTAVDELTAALHRVYEMVEAIEDPQEAHDAAAALLDWVNTVRQQVFDLRNTQVRSIWQDGGLSLAQLGERIGVSKARADQIIRATS